MLKTGIVSLLLADSDVVPENRWVYFFDSHSTPKVEKMERDFSKAIQSLATRQRQGTLLERAAYDLHLLTVLRINTVNTARPLRAWSFPFATMAGRSIQLKT